MLHWNCFFCVLCQVQIQIKYALFSISCVYIYIKYQPELGTLVFDTQTPNAWCRYPLVTLITWGSMLNLFILVIPSLTKASYSKLPSTHDWERLLCGISNIFAERSRYSIDLDFHNSFQLWKYFLFFRIYFHSLYLLYLQMIRNWSWTL